jgi:peptidoglycan/LPS O-acetylase OafA/YrhL
MPRLIDDAARDVRDTLVAVRSMPQRAGRIDPGGFAARLHALDALRGIAMMLGIVLHGSVAYMARPMPDLLWPAMDGSRSAMFDALFWWIHSFRIPLFFLIAGFFAMRLHDSRGWRGFLANRLRRVALPFLLACIVILPITYYAWCLGWLVTGRCTVDEILAWKFADPLIQENFKGPAHLWFLEYLLIIYACFVLVRESVRRMAGPIESTGGEEGGASTSDDRRSRGIAHVLFSPLRPLILAVPTAGILALDPSVFTGFHNTFVPSVAGLAYYAVFFATGCALERSASRLPDLQRGAWLYVLASMPLLALTLALIDREHELGDGSTPGHRAMLGGSISLLAWLGVFGWVGVFMRLFSVERQALRFIADASYWVYLVHLPIVGLLQVALLRVNVHATIKFAIVVVAATSIALVSYRALVRDTMIGRLLGGRRRPGGAGSENRLQSGHHPGQTSPHPTPASAQAVAPLQSRRISP